MEITVELPYCPPIAWMALVWPHSVLRLEACEHYQKAGYRNRCHIAGPNGLQRLSIPLEKGKHQQTPIREVKTVREGEPWSLVHWRSVYTAYGRAPYFEYYAPDLEAFYRRKPENLFALNLELLEFFLKKMGWNGRIEFTESYRPKGSGLLRDFRDSVSPKSATLPAWFYPAPYPQVFLERHGFLPNLSVLDLLFCCGKQSGEILQKSLTETYI